MDQQASARWLETLKREQSAKQKWQDKYLTDDMRQREYEEEQAAREELSAMEKKRPGRISERDAMELRLKALDDEPVPTTSAEPVLPEYEVMRRRVAAEVAATRQRSHRFTGDLSTESMLKDIGPQLWTSVNPMYAPSRLTSTNNRTHFYDKTKGWGDKVDKTHHLKQDAFMAHADKCLQLGEKPFVSGGMKATK